MRRTTLTALLTVLATAAASVSTASAGEITDALGIEIPSMESLKVKQVGFLSHCGDDGCDSCCDYVEPCCIDDCCADACCPDSCDGCALFGCLDGGCGLLGGLVKPSDTCFDDFISPMINFVHFEDPRTVSELRPIFVNHWMPSTIGPGIPAGGQVQLYALQFRAALTERLSLIGVKDGYIVDNTDGVLGNAIIDDGWAAVTAGLKYNFLRDTCSGTLATAGFTYEIPIGSQQAAQDIGDGEFHFFLTGGKRLLDGDAHFLSSFGWRVPVDGNAQTESIHWSNHIDYRLTEKFYIFTELAWWHWTDDADAPVFAGAGVGGQDLYNLSTSGVAGQSLVTQNFGFRIKPNSKTEIGVAYEVPLTDFRDVIASRLMFDLILRY